MTSTVFTDFTTPIVASWLNDVNTAVYRNYHGVNVKDAAFGAVGNGIADDTAAIQAAINSLAATNGVIRDNIGHNPVGLATPAVGASPYTYTAGQYHESVYITGGTVSSITVGGAAVYTSTDKTVTLGPGQSTVITYSSAPTVRSWRH